MVISQTTMVAVMTMTPLHMKDHGQADLSAFVIALHIVGMYGLAPLVGLRGRPPRARPRHPAGRRDHRRRDPCSRSWPGYHPALIFLGLFLLGLGWSCGLIGGSTLLTESVPVPDRVAVQGRGRPGDGRLRCARALCRGFVKAQLGFHILAEAAHRRRRRAARGGHQRPAPSSPASRRLIHACSSGFLSPAGGSSTSVELTPERGATHMTRERLLDRVLALT